MDSVGKDRRAQTAATSSVSLRPLEPADRALLRRWAEEPLVSRSLAVCTLREILGSPDGSAQGRRMAFIGHDPSTDAPFGLFCLSSIDAEVGQAELTKLVGEPEFRGKGLATAATRLLLEHGFGEMDLNRVYLRTLGGNLKNIRLNERLGFRFEGVLLEAHQDESGLRDVVLMGLLREWFEGRE